MTTLVGLDVGTTGVKAVAISPDGEVLATDEEPYPLSTPQPGWAEQDPELWWRAAEAVLGRLPFDEVRVGLLRPDARARLPRRGRPRPPPGDSLERSAHRGRVRRDRGDGRARAPDRADREPRADRLHGAEAALAPPPRARRVRAHPPDPASQGLRAAAADRRARHRRRGRLRHAALRRSQAALVGRGDRRARDPARVAAARLRVDGVRRRGRPAGGCARRRGRARPACCRSSSAPRASSSRRCRSTAPSPRRASTSSATPCPTPGRRWA